MHGVEGFAGAAGGAAEDAVGHAHEINEFFSHEGGVALATFVEGTIYIGEFIMSPARFGVAHEQECFGGGGSMGSLFEAHHDGAENDEAQDDGAEKQVG